MFELLTTAFIVQQPPAYNAAIILRRRVSNMTRCAHCLRIAVNSSWNCPPVKAVLLPFAVFGSCSRFNFLKVFPVRQKAIETCDMRMYSEPSYCANFGHEQSESSDSLLEFQADFAVMSSSKEDRESMRRKRIGLANKGRAPWNKGRKYTAEVRAWISQRTMEAMRNPKVRKKLQGAIPRAHSDEVKAKIASSQRKRWEKRLKWKRMSDRVYLLWAGCIAEAARRGGISEEELDWDSYARIQREIDVQQLQSSAEFTSAKKGQEEVAEAAPKMERKPIRNRQKENFNATDSNLKARLAKLHRKKSTSEQLVTLEDVAISHRPLLEKLDLQLMEKVKLQKKVPLADQIRDAKSKRNKSSDSEVSTSSPNSEE